MKIYLDDERPAPEGWHRTYTARETIKALELHGSNVTEISLDHDLGLKDEDGYDVLLYLEVIAATTERHIPLIRVHTANPSAEKKMLLAVYNIHKFVKER